MFFYLGHKHSTNGGNNYIEPECWVMPPCMIDEKGQPQFIKILPGTELTACGKIYECTPNKTVITKDIRPAVSSDKDVEINCEANKNGKMLFGVCMSSDAYYVIVITAFFVGLLFLIGMIQALK